MQTDRQEAAESRNAALLAVLEVAERAFLAKDTSIYYQRDDANGRMYLHVVDKRTGDELYRIPRDYTKIPDGAEESSKQIDLEV